MDVLFGSGRWCSGDAGLLKDELVGIEQIQGNGTSDAAISSSFPSFLYNSYVDICYKLAYICQHML